MISEDTGVGDPSHSSAEKGAAFFEDLTQKFADFFYEVAVCDRENLYE